MPVPFAAKVIITGMLIYIVATQYKIHVRKNPNSGIAKPEKEIKSKLKKIKKEMDGFLDKMNIEKQVDEFEKEVEKPTSSKKPAFEYKKVQLQAERATKKHFPELYSASKSAIGQEMKSIQAIAKDPKKAKGIKSKATMGYKLKSFS